MRADEGFYYEAEVALTRGRSGELKSEELPTLQVAAPPGFGGRENTWTPEHLYVGAVASCFMLTFLALAERSKLELMTLGVSGRGKLDKIEGAGFQITEVTLKPTVVVRHVDDMQRVERLLAKAEQGCFIAASIKSRVRVLPRVYHRQLPVCPCPAVSVAPVPG